jgi:hypothetical protein
MNQNIIKKRNLSSDIGVIRTFKFIQNKAHFALGEFVDNSIQSYVDNKDQLESQIQDYKPRIEITTNRNQIVIRDNCAGISEDDEERAFLVAAPNPNIAGIGTFGMGMKVSACWFSDNWEVETKNINENLVKKFTVDVNKILKTGESSIGPTVQKRDCEPYTEIIIKKPFKGRITSANSRNIKDYLSDIYRWFLFDGVIDILYNGERIEFDPPKYKTLPYVDDKNGESYEWVTKIPDLDLGDGLKAWGVAYLRNIGNISNQRGFGIFWKNRLVTGSAGDPWMPSKSDFDTKEEVDRYSIYLGSNNAINQRLEGWLHISPEFEVPSTKNGVLWHGKDLILMEQLKSYLSQCELVGVPDKKFNIFRQAKKGAWTKNKTPDLDIDEIDKEFDDEAIDEIKGEGEEIIIPETLVDVSPDPEEEIIRQSDSIVKIFRMGDSKLETTIDIIRDQHAPFYEVINGPDGNALSISRKMRIKVNTQHPFVLKYFNQGDGALEREGLIKLAYALVIAEVKARDNSSDPIAVRRFLNDILREVDL